MTHYKETAIHEAGHALMYYLFYGNLDGIVKIQVYDKPKDGNDLGGCVESDAYIQFEDKTRKKDYYSLTDFNDLLGLLCVDLGGAVAEKVRKDSKRYSRSLTYDMKVVESLFEFSCNINEREEGKIVDYALLVTDRALSNEKLTLEEIADALLIAPDMTLTGEEVLRIIKKNEKVRHWFSHKIDQLDAVTSCHDERSKKNTK